MDFSKRYAKLNIAQKTAVDTIDGPVMVIAGPGTGKTELLSVRVANILKKTDTLPENILCLTFTESGANAMRERLADVIGKDAYKVAIHTFHSFGTEVMNQNGEFFYRGANYRAADELNKYEIIQGIFEKLPHNSPLASKNNDEYTHLSDCLTVISEIKKSGLSSTELVKILDQNDIVIKKIHEILSPIFASRVSNKTTALLAGKVAEVKDISEDDIMLDITSLSKIIYDTLQIAVDGAVENNSTKTITAWRSEWFKKNEKGDYILKSYERQQKLRVVCDIYEKYLDKMHKSKFYDFDDMILEVVHKMEENDDLRYNLQEKYQYILVDEFQDTNMAQMRILHNLTNNIVNEGMPNIMVVGDDDQAIYSFQGADVSNIIDFRSNYAKAVVITLTENYRSTSDILDHSRNIIVQGQNRLENTFSDVNKKLSANNSSDAKCVEIFEAETVSNERRFIARDIKSKIAAGEKPNNIAVLTRRHAEINALLPYLYDEGIAVNYERHDNILEQPIILFIEKIAQLLINIAKGNLSDANAALPEILAHPSWGFTALDIWKLSLESRQKHVSWLENMETNQTFVNLHKWLIENALKTFETPLEQMLDIIVGKPSSDDTADFLSPTYQYYFSSDKLKNNPEEYLSYLNSLITLRMKVREYQPEANPTLESFIDFIAKNRKIGATINATRPAANFENAINVMTAHKSKGLEFDHVYVINVIDSAWGATARSRSRSIGYPENLQKLAPAGETDDERLRLFYVAITRAKKELTISYSLENGFGKNTLRSNFLMDEKWQPRLVEPADNINELIENSEIAWYQTLTNPITSNLKELLAPMLEEYKLSVTHLHNFLDVSRGGPANFLMQNLLQFPQAKSANASFGTAIHSTMQQTHDHLIADGDKYSLAEIIEIFTTELRNQYLPKLDFEKYLQKGIDSLTAFFDQKYETFRINQKTELNFAGQNSIVESAHLTGKLDLADIDKANKLISVTDYKTGKPVANWNGRTDYEKIKLHNYKQQLMFYKLLIESSRDYHNFEVQSGILQFVEPTRTGDILSLESGFSQSELDDFKKLLNVVWIHIKNLDLPDISKYDKSFKGMLVFEQDLINETV